MKGFEKFERMHREGWIRKRPKPRKLTPSEFEARLTDFEEGRFQ